MDASGCNFCIAAVTSLTAVSDATISDSGSSTWNALVRQTTSLTYLRFHYAYNITGGSSHTITVSSSAGKTSVAALWFKVVETTSPFDKENSNFDNTGQPNFLNTGSVTPSTDNQVLVAGLSLFQTSSTPTIDSSFTSPAVTFLNAASNNIGVAISYFIQTTAGAKNPTWSFTGGFYEASNIATFKAGTATASIFDKSRFVRQAVKRSASY